MTLLLGVLQCPEDQFLVCKCILVCPSQHRKAALAAPREKYFKPEEEGGFIAPDSKQWDVKRY